MAGTGGNAYSIELAELDSIVADLEHCEAALDLMTGDLERDMRRFHSVWEGVSADAQREAQQEWEQGMQAMRVALAELRAAARTAHSNYTRVVDENTALWRSLG
ncbi:WXG100 family type VII secretion target [Nocardioides campestrisoli]|uniref:WXG100 family type VII secretion target n=1 Tax=Nocardioides campestrisoli TaxID=2736757 RepID=UPI0015E6C04A|nr:WXG100 family type VII secretion target [Nocardioides campestrisoli]